jgi:urease accessory protein UreF
MFDKKTKISLDDALEQDSIHTFEGADQKAEILKNLEEVKVGRKRLGKSTVKHRVYFYVDDEQLEYLESLTNRKSRTPSAVAKKMFLKNYEMYNKD